MTGTKADTPTVDRLYDELLVTLIQSGDRRAAERLVIRWQPRLIRTSRRLLNDDEQALVVVQEAWIAIFRGLGSLRDPARFAPWAYSVLRRRCADRIRGQQTRRNREGQLADEPATDSADEERLALRQAFETLPLDHRLAAQLFFVEGLTLVEIADAQNVPLGTAKSRIFHARRKLKAALSDTTEGDL